MWYITELYIPQHYSVKINSTQTTIQPDLLVLFGAGRSEIGSRPNQSFEFRIEKALELHKKYPNVKLLLSGSDRNAIYTETKTMMDTLLSKGIPRNRILRDSTSSSTFSSIFYLKRNHRAENILFISQEEHLWRALFLASCAGINASGVAAKRIDQPYHRYYLIRERQARIWSIFSGIVLWF